MRAQILATVIALGSLLTLAACEWLYPSVSLSGADAGSADAATSTGSKGGSPGEGSSGGAGSSGGSSSSGSSSGAALGGSSSSSGGGSGSSSGGGSSGSHGGSSSGSEGGSSSGSSGSGPGTGADDAGNSLFITFVQVASQDTGNDAVATVSAAYSSPQKAGDLNVVVVGWANPANQINAISDSAGNTYLLTAAAGSTSNAALAIYYAKNVAAAASNTVTVDLNGDDFLSLAILEYAGAAQLDQTAVSTGSGSTAATSTVVTSLPGELVFGAGEPDQKQSTNFSSAGTGFAERAITPISGMLAEDMIASSIGSYNASGGLTSSSPWVMQVVTFK